MDEQTTNEEIIEGTEEETQEPQAPTTEPQVIDQETPTQPQDNGWEVTYIGPLPSIEMLGYEFEHGVPQTIEDKEHVTVFNHKKSFRVRGSATIPKFVKAGPTDIKPKLEVGKTTGLGAADIPEDMKQKMIGLEKAALG